MDNENGSRLWTTFADLQALLIDALPLAAVLLSVLLIYLILQGLELLLSRAKQKFLWELLDKSSKSIAMLATLTGAFFLAPYLELEERRQEILEIVLNILWIVLVCWVAVKSVLAFSRAYLGRHDLSESENFEARRIHTQVRILEKLAIILILLVGAAWILMSFEEVRRFGYSILASAGVLGIIAGLAAQRSLSAFFAGLQIAVTQPIRLKDAVIVEGEWGWIEEITLTYVVVKIWDRRRLIVPVSRFMEQPFQNWTRGSADLLGPVYLYLDYRTPVEAVRQELKKIVRDSPHWDGEVCGVQVTDCKEHSMELRLLMSAPNASAAWDLRCFVRERMLEFLQREHPESLPVARVEVAGGMKALPPRVMDA